MSAESIHIRPLDPQEIGATALMVARANAQRDGEPLPAFVTDDQISDLQERISKPNVWAYVTADDDQVTGLALGYPIAGKNDSPNTVDTEYLSLLMVEPNSWGKGIASRLLDLVADRARDAGRRRLTLRTREADNDRARGVYEHKGFTLTGATKDSPYGLQVEYQLDLDLTNNQ